MQIDWPIIRSGAADSWHGTNVELTGWMIPLDPQAEAVDYFLLSADEPCCGGCVPRNPLTSVEVQMARPVAPRAEALTLRGRLLRLLDDPAGWRYRLIEARPVDAPHNEPHNDSPSPRAFSRRAFLASGAALGLTACAPGRFASSIPSRTGRRTTTPRWRMRMWTRARRSGPRRPERSPSTCIVTPAASSSRAIRRSARTVRSCRWPRRCARAA